MTPLPSLLIFSILITLIAAKISDKEYVSMPVLFHLDDYDRCMLYGDQALYCKITLQLHPKNPKNASLIWNTIEEISSDVTNYRHDLLRHGICIPETCPNITVNLYGDKREVKWRINEFYNQKYRHMGLRGEIIALRCETKDSPYFVGVYDILFIIFVVVYVTIIISATIYGEVSRGSSAGKLISALSIRRNWQRLMTVNLQAEDIQALSFFQAFRLYLMLDILFNHTILMLLVGPVSNTNYLEKLSKKGSFKLDIDPGLWMQIHTIISSWLFTYYFFMAHRNSANIPLSYFLKNVCKRYIRLTPNLAFMIAFSGTWIVHLGRGPVWDDYVGEEYRKCKDNWWTNLLYINNYMGAEMCFLHSWFLAVNMQLYLLSLPLLWLMWNYQSKIPLILGSVLCAHIILLFSVFYSNHWHHLIPPILESYYNKNFVKLKQYQSLTISSNSYLAGHLAGLAYGYLFYKYRNVDLFHKKVCRVLCWIVSCGLIFCILTVDQLYTKSDRLFNATYGSLKRIIFVSCFGLILLLMAKGNKWVTKSPLIHVLGRLSFGVYIIHPTVQRILGGRRRSPNYLCPYTVLVETIVRDLTFVLLGTLFVTLFIEMPVVEVEKWLTSKPKKVILQVDHMRKIK